MALKNDLEELKKELAFLDDQFKSVGQALKDNISVEMKNLDETTKKVVKSFQQDFTRAVSSSNKALDNQAVIREKILKGQNASKDIEKELQKVQKQREVTSRKLENLRKQGVKLDESQALALSEALDIQKSQLESLNAANTAQIAQRGLTGNILENAKEYLISLDKSGLSAKLLNGELNKAQKFSLITEAAFLAIAKGALEGSNNIANFEKNLGISYGSAFQLQNSLAITAGNSEKLFVISKDLNKAFTDLAAQTGLLADFGGDTLVTMTALTKQLGLGTNEASQLALLARTQGEDTEGILDNTVDTVNAINRQNKSAISAKAVLNDIATASKSIVVSLGMSPEILAEAATEARALGLNLEAVDKIASSLLDFESSIAAELEAELLLGQDINLEKARQAALTNDLATLTQEIGKNEGVINAFATGNRIQQEAAAKALGLSREELSGMVMQQEIMNLSQDEFIAKYGEQSYQQMQAQSASEKFASTMQKIQGIIGDIGTAFAPILDLFASFVGYLAESKGGVIALAGVMTTLAAISVMRSIASTITAFSALGPPGVIAGIAAAAGIAGMATAAYSKIQSVKDGMAPASKGPFTITDAYGATAITAAGDGVAVSPNINRGSSNSGEQKRTNMLLEKLLAKDTNISMDGRRLNDSMQTSAVAYNIGN